MKTLETLQDALQYVNETVTMHSIPEWNVSVYQIECQNLSADGLFLWMDAARRQRMERFRKVADKQRSIGAELLFLKGIWDFYQFSNEQELTAFLQTTKRLANENGKPYLSNASVHYNLSHSGNYAAAAFSPYEIGIDIEAAGQMSLTIAEHFFHPKEQEVLRSIQNPAAQQDRMTEYWVMKESFVKAVGKGLVIPLKSFCLNERREGICEAEYLPASQNYEIQLLNAAPGYRMAVCRAISSQIPAEM